jgi:MFS family permease
MAHTEEIVPATFQHTSKRQFRWYNVFIILFMALGSIEFGYASSIIATTLAQPSFISYFKLDTRDDAADMTGLMNSLYQVGGFLGIWTVPVVADRCGRKMAITYCALVNLFASAGLTGSTSMGMFLAFRFIAGWGAWTIVAAVPIWMNEVSPPNIRGILVDCHNVGFLLGYNLATWAGYGFYHLPVNNNWGWRGGMLIQSVWVVVLLSGMYWLPESPRWLMMQDRHAEAELVLQKLHMPEEAQVESLQIRQSIEFDRQHDSSWWAMLRKPSYRKRALYVMGMALSIHTSAILVITNYGPTIYGSLGFDTNKQLVYQIAWCAVGLGTGFMSFFLIDRFPRNKLLAFGVGGCACCMAVACGLIGRFTTPEQLEDPNVLALNAIIAFMFLLNCFYQLGLGKYALCPLGHYTDLTRWCPILLTRRNFPQPHPGERSCHWSRHNLRCKCYLPASRPNRIPNNRLQILPDVLHSWFLCCRLAVVQVSQHPRHSIGRCGEAVR